MNALRMLGCCLLVAGCCQQGVQKDVDTKLVITPAPASEGAVAAYQVTVNGKPLPLYSSRDQHWEKEYHFGTFDFEGKVEIRVRSKKPLSKVRVLPAEKFGIQQEVVSDHELVLKADRPFRVSIEPDGRNRPLLLFANGLERNVPSPDDPNVVYIPAGVHRRDCIKLTAGQTLYLAPGSILHGGVDATGDNITICGRGIIAGDVYKRFKGPNAFPINVMNGRNIVIRDVILRNSWSWTIVTTCCRNVLIDNVKICGSNMLNDDAIDLCNTSDVIVRNSFIRSQDDNIAIKGMMESREPCENIVVEDCELWSDKANIIRVGYECEAEVMRKITMRNIDVVHYTSFREPYEYWARCLFCLEPAGGMNIEDCLFENFTVHSHGSDVCVVIAHMILCRVGRSIYRTHLEKGPLPETAVKYEKEYTTYGNTRDITFRNFNVVGEKGDFRGELYFEGKSDTERVSNITFENFNYFGERLTQDFPLLTVKQFASGIVVK